jgi:site-specific recombinase XerD
MEASLAARSPVTLPGHHAGQPPAHAGHTLPSEVLTPEEARALLRVPSPRAPTGIRNRALFAVLYRGGLRISEALTLERRDLLAAACTLTVRHGKGNRHRTIGMDPAAFGLVARWLDERRRLGLHRPGVVFCTLDGHPLQAGYVRALLPRLARKAGIEKRVHPHGLRHTCAAELAIEGVPVPLIQQLGHASLHTTTVYLRHIAPVELVEKMRTRSWSL